MESFNVRIRDELLNREQVDPLREAEVLHANWCRHNNTRKSHSS
jgi:hypothetical protein